MSIFNFFKKKKLTAMFNLSFPFAKPPIDRIDIFTGDYTLVPYVVTRIQITNTSGRNLNLAMADPCLISNSFDARIPEGNYSVITCQVNLLIIEKV